MLVNILQCTGPHKSSPAPNANRAEFEKPCPPQAANNVPHLLQHVPLQSPRTQPSAWPVLDGVGGASWQICELGSGSTRRWGVSVLLRKR